MPSAVNSLTGRARRVGYALLACLCLVAVFPGTAAAAHGTGSKSPLPQPVAQEPAAEVTAVRKIDARTEDLTVRSPAMNSSIPVRVILPKSWDTKKNSTFPVLYMLHGGDDDYTSWTRETDVKVLAENSDVLIVMPDGGKSGYYSDWYLGASRWETFHTIELVQLMEREFRAGPSRAIVGLSMGGLGALNYTAHHPGMFRYVAAMSSYVDLNDAAVRLVLALGSYRDGIDIKQVWGDPNENADIWRAHNPSAMPQAFRGTTVHISCGNGMPGPLDQGHAPDVVLVGALAEAALPNSVKKFAASLRSSGVATTTHVYGPGTHSWPYWQRELHAIWPAVLTSLG